MWAIILLIWSHKGSRGLPRTAWQGDPALRQGLALPKATPHRRDTLLGAMRILTLPGHRATALIPAQVRSPELPPLRKGCDEAPHGGVLRPTGSSCRTV